MLVVVAVDVVVVVVVVIAGVVVTVCIVEEIRAAKLSINLERLIDILEQSLFVSMSKPNLKAMLSDTSTTTTTANAQMHLYSARELAGKTRYYLSKVSI